MSGPRKAYLIFNTAFLILVSLVCILPFIHLLAVSLSSSLSANAGEVKFWPVDFTMKSYEFVLGKSSFNLSLMVSLKRVFLGLIVNMFLVVITAYPLSKEVSRFKFRTAYAWFFAFTMFFSGGLIPTFIIVKETGLIDSIFSLIIPGALPVWNMILMLNFFRSIPKELEEAAIVDGASQFRVLWQIYIPASLPGIATITLFTLVGHWNSWFDGLMYLNSPDKYPLQTYLSTLITQMNKMFLTDADVERLKDVSEKTVKTAQIFLGALPILVVYPLLQRYFIKGIVLGSVKE